MFIQKHMMVVFHSESDFFPPPLKFIHEIFL